MNSPRFQFVGVKFSPEQYKQFEPLEHSYPGTFILFAQTDKEGNVYWGHEVENTLESVPVLDELLEIDSMDFPHVPAYIEEFLRPFGALHYWIQ
jgi:hypothetical protein